MNEQRKKIEKENWKEAEGIKVDEFETNNAFAQRLYSIKCNPKYLITIIKGYHLWWCSSHHQPSSHCKKDKLH